MDAMGRLICWSGETWTLSIPSIVTICFSYPRNPITETRMGTWNLCIIFTYAYYIHIRETFLSSFCVFFFLYRCCLGGNVSVIYYATCIIQEEHQIFWPHGSTASHEVSRNQWVDPKSRPWKIFRLQVSTCLICGRLFWQDSWWQYLPELFHWNAYI